MNPQRPIDEMRGTHTYRPATYLTPNGCKRWYLKHTSDSSQQSMETTPKFTQR